MRKLLIALAMTAAGLFAFGDGATSTPVSWAAKPLTADPSSIVSDGTLVYAYARSGQTVNGVQFEGVTLADDVKVVENDDISWTLSTAYRFNKDSSIDGIDDQAYNGLLSHSWDAHDDPAAAHPVVLKNLKPGATYIVQIVASQLVGDNDAKIWPMATPEDTFVDGTTPYIMSYAETDWPYGGTLIGQFEAVGDTATLYYGIKGSWCGVNAIQVRELTGLLPQGSAEETRKAIQDAIDEAADFSPAGTVMLGEGTFEIDATLNVTGGVKLVGQGWDKTVIKQTENSRVVTLSGASKLEGVTVTGGQILDKWTHGAGALVENGTISWCCIRNNEAGLSGNNNFGGGVYITAGVIDHSIIAYNTSWAKAGGGSNGGGIGINSPTGEIVVDACLIYGNSAPSGNGGAIYADMAGTYKLLTVRNTTIVNNSASGVGGVYLSQYVKGSNYDLKLINSIIVDNTTTGGTEGNLDFSSNTAGNIEIVRSGCAAQSSNNLLANGTAAFGENSQSFEGSASAWFAAAEDENFRLASRSPAAGAGVAYDGLGLDLDGEAFIASSPSAGCYEAAVAPVVLSPAHAEFYPTLEVSLSCLTEGAEIRYTTDGSEPTESSTLYEGPITVTESTVLKAVAFKSGLGVSAISSGEYVYAVPGTAPQPNFGIYEKAIKFTTAGYTGSETLTDFPVLVRISEDSLSGFSYADVDSLDDLRFADEQGNEIPCEIERWNPDGESQIWVKLPSMTAATTFMMYYKGQADTEADPTAVWTDYVGVWHMSEASGTVRDSTGHGLDAVPGGAQVSASVAFEGGPAGVARQFATAKGNKTYLVVPSYDSFALGNNFTIQGWFKASACFDSYSARYMSRKDKYTDGNGWEFEQRYGSGDKPKTTVSGRGATSGDAEQIVPDITAAWLDLALDYNGKNLQYYVNGAAGSKIEIGAAPTDNGKPLVIGNCPTGEESNWVGQMDEIRLRKGDVSADRMLGEHETVADVAFLSASAILQVSESTVVATPKFNPEAGTVYEATEVAISCLTEGATIRYTLDGTDPDETSAVYEGPITVAETTTIKAVAFKDDLDASKIVTAVYTYEAPVGPELGLVTVTPQSKTATISGAIVSIGNNGATACDIYLSLNGGAVEKVVEGATDSFSYAVQQLEPETEYAYVLSISNNAATVMGAETSGSFTTTVAPAGLEPIVGDADATRALIQDAIDAAAAESPAGTVVLAAGTFEINRELKLKGGVTLEGQGWDQTIIRQTTVANKDKTYAYRCVTIEGGSKLFGVTLTGGDAYQLAGGGALVTDGTISWCCISNNITSSGNNYAGAGVSFSSGKGSIDHSIIVGNKLQSGWGAGIGAQSPSGDILIDTCLICGNVNSGGSSGGVAIDTTTKTTTIRNCTIVGNTGNINVGGVYSNNGDNGKLVLVNNIITGNKQGSNEINLFIQKSHLDQEASSNCLVTGSSTGTGPWKDASVVSTLADKGFTNVAPTFVGAGNYRLAEESAGIAAGVSYDGIGVDLDKIAFAAETPSIGCYESGIMAAKPTFEPADGSEFYPTMSVTISCETEGAVIRYTLDGTVPTESSAEYTEPIVLSETTTIKARAFAAGVGPSPVVTGKFILVRPTPEPAEFSKCVEITLNTALADTEITTGLPALVKLDPEVITGFDYADFTLENGGDMMFTDADGKAIPHEVDTWNPEGVSLVWVKIPSTAADTVIKLYYGNGTVSSAEKTDVWSDYVGVWHLNEAGGANTDVNVYDSTANGYTGVAKGHASSGSTGGKIGSAWTISDSSNKGDTLGGIFMNSMKDVELGNSFTVSAWLWHRKQDYNWDHVFYRKNASGDAGGFASEINNGSYGALNVYGSGNTSSACTIPDTRETWVHYSVSFGAKVNNDYVIYTIANGGTPGWKTNAYLPTDNGLPLAFGTDCDNNDISWKGAFDEIRIRKGDYDANYLKAEYKAMNMAADDIFTFGDVEDTDPSFVAAPVFDPEDGLEFSTPITVALTCRTAGAQIYYTTDGEDPTSESSAYADPIAISATTTIKAVAIKEGTYASDIVTATYTFVEPVAPSFGDVTVTTKRLANEADISGAIASVGNDGATACDVYLAYGTDAANLPAATKIAEGVTDSFTYTIKGLSAETTYAYVLSISNDAVTVRGAETSGSFTTFDPSAPILPAESAAATRQAVQSVLDEAAAMAQPGTVTLGEGLFEIDAQLMVTGGVTLVGQGMDKTVLKYAGAVNNLDSRVATLADGSKLVGVTVTGAKVGQNQYVGGAVTITGTTGATISWCCVTNNVNNNGCGGGIGVYGTGSVKIDHTIVADNQAGLNIDRAGGGIGIRSNGALNLEIDTCLIYGNKVGNKSCGAGVGIVSKSVDETDYTKVTAVIRNTTIAGNEVTGTGKGGGLYTTQKNVTLQNCIISENAAPSDDDVAYVAPDAAPATDHCLVGGDPKFVGNGDYHLTKASPAKGAGVTYDGIGVDLDNVEFAEVPSIGCYEWVDNTPRAGMLLLFK